jgi:hypothetical protein
MCAESYETRHSFFMLALPSPASLSFFVMIFVPLGWRETHPFYVFKETSKLSSDISQAIVSVARRDGVSFGMQKRLEGFAV